MNQNLIDSRLAKIKSWYLINWPVCIFCNHRVGENAQLAHLIRKSETRSELQYEKLNTGLAHHDCHDIFDNKPYEMVYLPRIYEVLYIIWLLDPDYFNRISSYVPNYNNIYDSFPDLPYKDIEHHGELIHVNQWLLVG